MLKAHWKLISKLERIGDTLLVVIAFFLSYYWRDEILLVANHLALPVPKEFNALGPVRDYFVTLAIAVPLYNAVLSVLGAYRSMRFSSVWSILRLACASSAVVFLSEGSLLYLLKLDLSRSFVGLFCLTSGLFIFIERVAVLRLLRYYRLQGRNFRNMLIVGTGPQARKLYFEINRVPELGIRVAGFVQTPADSPTSTRMAPRALRRGSYGSALEEALSEVYDLPARVIATAESFEVALKKHAIDEVLFTDVVKSFPIVEELSAIATEEGVRVTLVADLFSREIFRSEISYFGSFPLVHYDPSPVGSDNSALVVKRGLDIAASALLLVVLSPVMLIAAAAVVIDSKGPVFFRQKRVGLNGRIFVLLKFRSMIEGAEKLLMQLKEKNEMAGPAFKMKNDPRITRVGRFLRRYSIDELPQLINVLRGDMSLVGPRPPLPDEVSLYMRKQRRRLSMRPGITCTWQVSGRNNIPDFETWAQLDLDYIDNWSLLKDFKLLLRTIPAVFTGSGAR